MAHYRKVDCRIWNDSKFRALPDDSKLAFLFLLTHPALTMVGAMRGNPPGFAAELGWTVARFESAADYLDSLGMARFDAAAGLVVLPQFTRYNPADNPNQVKGWAAALDLLPESPLRVTLVNLLRDYLRALPTEKGGDSMRAAWPLGLNPSPNPSETVSKSGTGAGTGTGTGRTGEPAASPLPPAKTTPKKAKAEPAYSPGFLRFWAAIPSNPRKYDQAGAFRIWERKNLEPEADAIVAWAEAMAKSADWTKPAEDGSPRGFIPAVTVMLNQERFRAPVTAAPPPRRREPGMAERGEDPRDEDLTPEVRGNRFAFLRLSATLAAVSKRLGEPIPRAVDQVVTRAIRQHYGPRATADPVKPADGWTPPEELVRLAAAAVTASPEMRKAREDAAALVKRMERLSGRRA